MADIKSFELRSKNMAAIRSVNTRPELAVRKYLLSRGYRYRSYYKLPGKPDIVFIGKKIAVFVHGCFWHRHHDCALARMPKSRLEFWAPKLERNRVRDGQVRRKLRRLGWQSLVIWECELRDIDRVCWKLIAFLES